MTDPEGRTLNITVRAIDRAGRSTVVNQTISTELSAADAPDTTILSSPANPSPTNSASFVVTGTVSAAAFDCQLDEGPYTPCGTAVTYTDLSKGSHTFRVRAIDGRGYPDLSAAEYTWMVNASVLDATLTGQPANPSNSRTAPFTFTGTGSSLECSLDGMTFSPCTSPTTYSGLSNGEHTFQVRAHSGTEAGAAARYVWTVVNGAPVATGQTVNVTQDTAVAIALNTTDEDALTYRLTQPTHGLLLGIPPALTYAPNTGFVGQDSFTFVANDGQVDSTVATISINVAGNEPPTLTPTATPTETPTTLPTETPTNTPVVPTATPTETSTNTPVPAGTFIGTCGGYTVYQNNGVYSAAGWTGAIKVGTNSNNTINGAAAVTCCSA